MPVCLFCQSRCGSFGRFIRRIQHCLHVLQRAPRTYMFPAEKSKSWKMEKIKSFHLSLLQKKCSLFNQQDYGDMLFVNHTAFPLYSVSELFSQYLQSDVFFSNIIKSFLESSFVRIILCAFIYIMILMEKI